MLFDKIATFAERIIDSINSVVTSIGEVANPLVPFADTGGFIGGFGIMVVVWGVVIVLLTLAD